MLADNWQSCDTNRTRAHGGSVGEVFLSYSRQDEATARRVAKTLQAAGHDVWWDSQLPAHRAYSEVIETRLREAKAVVVLWSKSAAQSQWVRAEADLARSEGKLVQASLDGALPPMPFNQIQCASLKGWRGSANHAGWAKLASSVQALVSGEEAKPSTIGGRSSIWARLRPRWLAAVGLLLLIAAAVLVSRYAGGPDAKLVVAVLPFESIDSRDESLVAGIWEDTRQAIGRNPQLLVLGPNTAREIAQKGSGTARKLADYLVEASVRSVGDRVRVSANLVRTDDGAEVWSKSFDRQLADVFALQSEIAGEIEGHIRGRLAERGGIQPQNIATSGEVYALYSDARIKVRMRQSPKYEEAQKQLEQVIRMDPNFAPGWATLAVIKKFGFAKAAGDSAAADARRAIALAPNLAAGHAALGFALGKGPVAQASLRRALQLDPNDIEAMNWLANSLDQDTQRDEKLRLYSKVIELEPLWWPAILNKLNILFESGDKRAVDAELARVQRIGDERMTAMILSETLRRRGDLSGAVKVALAHYKKSPADRELMGSILFQPLLQLGMFDVADKISPPPSPWVPLIRRNDPKVIDMVETAMPPEKFWTFGFLAEVTGRIYFLSRQGQRLARQYRAVASTAEQFQALVGEAQFPDLAPVAALALRSAGDEAQARRLLELAEDAAAIGGARSDDLQVRLARIYAVQGRTDAAIGLLGNVVGRGWLPPYLPLHTDIGIDAPLALLKKDPRFEPLRQKILRHLAKERAELGAVSVD